MKDLLSNLTADQRRFGLIGLISVIGIFVLLFFINGLSDVQYTNPVSEEVKLKKLEAAMVRVLEMEYETYALYTHAADELRDAEPFFSIMVKEAFHIGNLIEAFAEYKFEVPENKFIPEDVTLADSIPEICADALALEQKQADVYAKTDLDILGYTDIEAAFGSFNLQSRDNYIPKLEACIAGE